MWNRIAESHDNGHIPSEVESRLSNLTRTAEMLTGVATGFEQRGRPTRSRGGISATNAVTTATYTLKSLVGTLCGIAPLVADFNREYQQHIYQPCMPHVLDVLNRQVAIMNQTKDITSWPWKSTWMQSVTEGYDNQKPLMPAMGFKDVISKESLLDPHAKHFPPKSDEVNYYGFPDTELRDYLRDAITAAERNHTRLFLTHLTGTTHHPWGIPNDTYMDLMGQSQFGLNHDLNKYLNTIGYVDQWLAEIIEILEETGVANETLLVVAGDQ